MSYLDNIDFELDRKTLPELIAEKLEAMILSDSSQVEQKLPSEQSLALSFGVSRPVIREALVLLRGRGLVTPKNGEGSFIREPPAETLTQTLNRMVQLKNIHYSDVFAVRMNLEIMAARLAAERITLDGLEELRSLNRQMEKSNSDPELRAKLDIAFHAKIAEESGNPLLSVMVNSLASLLVPMIVKSLTLAGTGMDGVAYHERIIVVLEEGDPSKAADMIRGHLMLSIRDYESYLKSSGTT